MKSLSVSRSTVDRAISELRGVDCIHRSGSAYRSTEIGRIALEEYASYTDRMQSLEEATPVIKSLPRDSVTPGLFSREASVETANPRRPLHIFDRLSAVLESAKRFRGTVPVALAPYFEVIRTSAAEHGIDVELTVDAVLYDDLQTESRTSIERLERSKTVRLVTSDVATSYAVWIAETSTQTYAGIIVYDQGRVEGMIVNSTPAATEWALNQYREFKKRGESG
ncbi:hypothetical protein CV102_01095 [Natronococcus pandeyae]|uniref:Uncharacterized protein n=1 Tax=Natronococcus pandeyae TaxID=2055836 RepID=A0A8J8TS42_9EURY|nr:hypothetical protein CV102_01095 [Natronococcus pandeyae]